MADDDGLAAALGALPPEIRMMLAEDLPVDLQRCRDAFAAARWGELREYVHRIKGTAAFCRLNNLEQVCVRIEKGLAVDIPASTSDIRGLAEEAVKVIAALES